MFQPTVEQDIVGECAEDKVEYGCAYAGCEEEGDGLAEDRVAR